jgi:peptidoglycan hydrolase-like protein with peptidoglycan-binding domain
MKKLLIIPIFILFIALNAEAYTFSQNLTIGSRGEEVRQLQIYLNNYSTQTQVATFGAGSPGNETDYFGQLTKNALINFQNMNREAVLTPVGLFSGSGYFGPSTRSFINDNTATTQLETLINSPQITTPTNTNSEFLILDKITVAKNDSIFVGGQKEIEDLDFYLNNKKLKKDCDHSHLCELEVENFEEGTHKLTTDDSSIQIENIVVVDAEKPSIKIGKVKLGEVNTVSGENLTERITVYTSFGEKVVQTNGNSFDFTIPALGNNLQEIEDGSIYIKNSNGLTSDIIDVSYEY